MPPAPPPPPRQPEQSLLGARVIVTGGSKGIGKEIVRGLLEQGAHVTVAVRDVDACQRVRAELGGTCVCAQLDLEDPSSIRRFAAEQLADKRPLHLLVNNAGVMGVGYQAQPAGAPQHPIMDRHMLVNHLGPFLLTKLLSDALQGSRVVNVASRAHRLGSLLFDQETGQLVQRPGVGWFKRYGDSKLANILFTAELQRRWAARGVAAVSVSPGLVATNLFSSLPWPLNHLSNAFMPLVAQTPKQGARTPLYACTSPDVTGVPEQLFLHNCKPQKPLAAARDEKLARQLWEYSEAFWEAQGSAGSDTSAAQ